MEGFLALLSGILFSIVIWAIAKDRIDTVRERDAEQQRRLTLVALRKQYIEASDDVSGCVGQVWRCITGGRATR
jgi:hypothetical protein